MGNNFRDWARTEAVEISTQQINRLIDIGGYKLAILFVDADRLYISDRNGNVFKLPLTVQLVMENECDNEKCPKLDYGKIKTEMNNRYGEKIIRDYKGY